MKAWEFILLAVLLALPGCNEDTPAIKSSKVESARIEKEVTRRVEAAKLESTVRTSRLQTIRMIGLAVLAGGSLGGLVWLRQTRLTTMSSQGSLTQRNRPPQWTDHFPPHTGRVIDFPTSPANHRRSHPANPGNHTP